MNIKSRKLIVAVCLLLISAVMVGTASFAWFSMNTEVDVDGIEVEAYSDALFLQISEDKVNYDTSVTLGNGEPLPLRVITPVDVTNVLKVTAEAASGFYTAANATTDYYVMGDAKTDSYSALNYIKVDNDTLEVATDLSTLFTATFTRTDNAAVAVAGTKYYEKVNNGYVEATVDEGESVYGLYTAEIEAASGAYAGETADYYAYDAATKTYSIEAYLTQGTDLSNFFTLTTETANIAAVTSDIYVLYGEDYVCVYDYTGSAEVNLSKETFWGRTYSDTLGQAQPNNTLSVVKKANLADTYYYYDTVYLRNAMNTVDATNLRIADVVVSGKANDLSDAIRVLFVATNGKGEVATYTYNNKDGMDEGGEILFATLLGNEAEVVTVEMYVYFDGKDVATATTAAGVLNGQSISVKFTIDEHDYN